MPADNAPSVAAATEHIEERDQTPAPDEASQRLPYFWCLDEQRGADLAALRRGLGRRAGDVPSMWRFYRNMRADGVVNERLRAEHVALSLYAAHQQSIARNMHWPGVGLGEALFALRRSDSVNTDAVDRRFAAAATASDLGELIGHLRGLIHRLRDVRTDHGRGQGLDYTALVHDLADWQRPGRAVAVRRRWGAQYFSRVNTSSNSGSSSNTNEARDPKEETR